MIAMPKFWDKDGHEISLLEWSKLFCDYKYRLIAKDCVEKGNCRVKITTVWIGDNFEDEMLSEPPDKPRVFGTLITIDGQYGGQLEMRHHSAEQAQVRHAKLVQLASEQTPLEAISRFVLDTGDGV